MNVHVDIVRVFANEENKFGSPVGIVIDDRHQLNSQVRQAIATKLKFSETAFLDNQITGSVTLFNPASEVRFAGYAIIGVSYYLSAKLKRPVMSVQCSVGQIETFTDDDLRWIKVATAYAPAWHFEQLRNAKAVENLDSDRIEPTAHTVYWAWIDKDKGIIRARTFAPDWGIPEDEANGSGAMILASTLNKELEIRHGRGSVIKAKPISSEYASVGGRVVQVSPLDVSL